MISCKCFVRCAIHMLDGERKAPPARTASLAQRKKKTLHGNVRGASSSVVAAPRQSTALIVGSRQARVRKRSASQPKETATRKKLSL